MDPKRLYILGLEIDEYNNILHKCNLARLLSLAESYSTTVYEATFRPVKAKAINSVRVAPNRGARGLPLRVLIAFYSLIHFDLSLNIIIFS